MLFYRDKKSGEEGSGEGRLHQQYQYLGGPHGPCHGLRVRDHRPRNDREPPQCSTGTSDKKHNLCLTNSLLFITYKKNKRNLRKI